jgi:hypothetical protein
MTLVAVAPHKYVKGFDGSQPAQCRYDVMELAEALSRTYPTDAHLVTYVVKGWERQPRINKAGLPLVSHRVEVGVFFCDVDNPAHGTWTEELRAAALAQDDSLPILQTVGIYHTAHGRRIVQPLDSPIAVQEVEPYLKRWLLELERAGIAVDWACGDWTRHFRLPNVRIKGHDFRSPHLCLERMRPIALAPLNTTTTAPAAASGTSPPTPVVAVDWSRDLPPGWQPRIEPVAAAIRAVTSEWHTLFLAIAGALLARGVPPEHLPAICRSLSLSTETDTRTDDREAAARTTVQRRLSGQPTTGWGALASRWPAVAEALDAALATGNEARVRAQIAAEPDVPVTSLAETTAALEDAIRHAPDGLTLIQAECGLGKTKAAMHVAAERAARPYASKEAKGERAPPQSKTAISVDKHDLAIQIADDLTGLGAKVRRIFGPLSVKNEDGTPACRYHAIARPLVEGGQTMQWELCQGRGDEPCEFAEGCIAKEGVEGPAEARITVGPHALLNALDAAAGTTGLLVIDEPPELLDTVRLSLEDLATAQAQLPAFDERFAAAARPALDAVYAWVAELATPGAVTTIPEAVRTTAHRISPASLDQAHFATCTAGDAVECLAAGNTPEREGRPPLMKFEEVRLARRSVDRATLLGAASKALWTLYRAVVSKDPVAARVEDLDRLGRVLLVTFSRDQLARALKREGAVVVMDANADLARPAMAKVVGYEPPLHHFAAEDGARITRTLLRCGSATRKGWIKGGKLVIDGSLSTALQAALAWAQEDPAATRLGLITLHVVEVAIAAALHPDNKENAGTWKKLRQSKKALAEAREKLGPILRAWPGEVRLGHYGAVRGLNDMADVDCLVTLGDPWPNLGEVQNEVAYLGLPETWEARVEARCRAELQQAHGRLRTVHRARPGRALHVGNVLPAGTGWSSGRVEYRRLENAPRTAVSTMPATEILAMIETLGGTRAAARELGCAIGAVHNFTSGKRKLPVELEAKLRGLVERSLPATSDVLGGSPDC